MKNKEKEKTTFKKFNYLSISRRIHVNVWEKPLDPSVYCRMDLEASQVLKFLEKIKNKTDKKVTVNHFVAKVIGHCLQVFPEINSVLIGNKFFQQSNINLMFMTNIQTSLGYDISRFLITDIDQKSIVELAEVVQEKSKAIRMGQDKETEDTKKLVNQIPNIFLYWLLNIMDFIVYELNFDIPRLGFSKKLRGSAILSATGSLGLEVTYVPLSHLSRCPLVFTVGKVRKMPVVVNDKVDIGQVITITFTYDHRYMDGAHSADIQNVFQKIFESPENYLSLFE